MEEGRENSPKKDVEVCVSLGLAGNVKALG